MFLMLLRGFAISPNRQLGEQLQNLNINCFQLVSGSPGSLVRFAPLSMSFCPMCRRRGAQISLTVFAFDNNNHNTQNGNDDGVATQIKFLLIFAGLYVTTSDLTWLDLRPSVDRGEQFSNVPVCCVVFAFLP